MLKRIDFKSACIGLLLGIAAAIVLGGQARPAEVGRYQIDAYVAGDSTGAYIIDTRTGQAWRRYREVSVDLGTPERPKLDRMEGRELKE